jgi:hypothetical protein
MARLSRGARAEVVKGVEAAAETGDRDEELAIAQVEGTGGGAVPASMTSTR